MTEFNPDWPHGWQTRDGDHVSLHYVGSLRNGDLMFETADGDILIVDENGKNVSGQVTDEDIINAPAPKPEPRKIWVNAYLSSEGYLWSDIGHTNRDKADSAAADVLPQYSTRVACVCITEGDGLEENK